MVEYSAIETAKNALQHYFGYKSFRPHQKAVVECLLRGEDCLAIMPTGAGKSICFQIPALVGDGITLVFTPLISLMKDQVDGLQLQNVPATYLNSSVTGDEFGRRVNAVQNGRIKLLYLAPERLENEWFYNLLLTLPIRQVIIDEAHCVSQWGHDFRIAYQRIAPFIAALPHKPIVGAFTATATEEVRRDMRNLLGLHKETVFVTSFDRPNLQFAVARAEDKMAYLLQYVMAHKEESGIIYCATRKDVERVYSHLVKSGIRAGCYHGGLDDELRKEQQELFIYDKVQIMVATNAFGMGIDKSNVRYILHYQMPRNMEGYYQEAGRAGRDGGPGECILLYSGRDVLIHKFLIERAQLSPERQERELVRLNQMVNYCFTQDCLRSYILTYFGEKTQNSKCMNCSNCLGKHEDRNLTAEAKMVFRAVEVTGERYGMTFIADFLAGKENERIRRFGYDNLPAFGRLQHWDSKDIKQLIRLLTDSGYIHSSGGKYPVLSLQPAARQVLRGVAEVTQRVRVEAPKKIEKTRGEQSLFAHLRAHRKSLARAEGVPPYLIFSDTVLIDMAALKPRTLADFYKLKGVGEVKLEKYGLSFLKAIAAYKEEHT